MSNGAGGSGAGGSGVRGEVARTDGAGAVASAREAELSSSDDGYGDFADRRNRMIRITAWVTIVALVLVGGGATVLTLLFS